MKNYENFLFEKRHRLTRIPLNLCQAMFYYSFMFAHKTAHYFIVIFAVPDLRDLPALSVTTQ